MTEAEWLACADPLTMLDYLRGRASDRKLRLYACADCRRKWSWFDNDEASRRAVEVAERYADGEANKAELAAANRALSGSVVHCATLPRADESDGAWGVAHSIAEGVSQCFEGDEIEVADNAEKIIQSRMVREVFGNPFHPVTAHPRWLTSTAVTLAQAIYAERAFDRLPILADALEDAGCDDPDLLGHCRGSGPHVRGCWAVDLVLGKA